MNWTKMNNDEVLLKGGIMINNSIADTDILDRVTLYGYTVEKLNVGKQVLTEAETQYSNYIKEYGEQTEAQKTYDQIKHEANHTYMTELKIARIAFSENTQAITTLELNGRRKKAIAKWLQQALNFYRAILNNADWLATMTNYGQTQEKLSAELTKVESVSTLLETLKREIGEAQNATELRDQKFHELINWLGDYEEIAAIALEDQPQLLEKLGIIVK